MPAQGFLNDNKYCPVVQGFHWRFNEMDGSFVPAVYYKNPKTTTMVINTNRHDKLSGYNVLHMKINDQIFSKSVEQWIAHDPVLLYQAVMGNALCCVTLPLQTYYYPSLRQTMFKKLEEVVSRIQPQLIGEKETRKLKRVATGHFKKKEREKQKELEEQRALIRKKRSNGIWR